MEIVGAIGSSFIQTNMPYESSFGEYPLELSHDALALQDCSPMELLGFMSLDMLAPDGTDSMEFLAGFPATLDSGAMSDTTSSSSSSGLAFSAGISTSSESQQQFLSFGDSTPLADSSGFMFGSDQQELAAVLGADYFSDGYIGSGLPLISPRTPTSALVEPTVAPMDCASVDEKALNWWFSEKKLSDGFQLERPPKKRSLMRRDEDVNAAKKQQLGSTKSTMTFSPTKEPQSIAAKNRREKISERLKILQDLVPNGTKVDLVTMLEKAISYVKFLQLQVKVLATDEFWPEHGGKAPEIGDVKEAIDAILASHQGMQLDPPSRAQGL